MSANWLPPYNQNLLEWEWIFSSSRTSSPTYLKSSHMCKTSSPYSFDGNQPQQTTLGLQATIAGTFWLKSSSVSCFEVRNDIQQTWVTWSENYNEGAIWDLKGNITIRAWSRTFGILCTFVRDERRLSKWYLGTNAATGRMDAPMDNIETKKCSRIKSKKTTFYIPSCWL